MITVYDIAERIGVRITHKLPADYTPDMQLGEPPGQVWLLRSGDEKVIFVPPSNWEETETDWYEWVELALHELAHAVVGWDVSSLSQEVACYTLQRRWIGELSDERLRQRALELTEIAWKEVIS